MGAMTATRCVSCGKPMQLLRLAGHYGREVHVDLCAGCHLLWFDGVESVNLAGRGVLDLLRAIATSHGHAHVPLPPRLACPRCRAELKRVANFTSLGPTAQHECPRGHGAAQSFSLYLAEKGFVRPLYRPEIEQLRKSPQERQAFACLNCGGAIDPRQRDTCRYCASPLKVLDVLPLMRAVDRQTGQLAPGALASEGMAPRSFPCAQCGQPVDPARDRRCPACAMPIALTDLDAALAMMEPLAAAVDRSAVTRDHRLQRLSESLDRAPRGLPPLRPVSGFRAPWWIFALGAGLMSTLGALVFWFR